MQRWNLLEYPVFEQWCELPEIGRDVLRYDGHDSSNGERSGTSKDTPASAESNKNRNYVCSAGYALARKYLFGRASLVLKKPQPNGLARQCDLFPIQAAACLLLRRSF